MQIKQKLFPLRTLNEERYFGHGALGANRVFPGPRGLAEPARASGF
jgi:hypothetical protein